MNQLNLDLQRHFFQPQVVPVNEFVCGTGQIDYCLRRRYEQYEHKVSPNDNNVIGIIFKSFTKKNYIA